MRSFRVAGLQGLVVLLCTFVLACEQKDVRASSRADLALARAYFPELAPGAVTSNRSAMRAPPVDPSHELTARISERGSLTLATRGLSFQVEPVTSAEARVSPRREDSAVFVGDRHFWFPAGASTEVEQGWRASRIEEAWVVDSARGVHRAAYDVTLPPSVRRIHDAGEYLEFLDGSGRPVLRFHPSVVRDAKQRSRSGSVMLSGGREDAATRMFTVDGARVRIATEVSLEGLTAPLVVDPGWSSTASMATERGQHAAVLLPSGELLVAAGVNRLGFVTTAERFDPATGTWASAGTVGVSGNVSTGVLLPTGKALVLADGSLTGRVYDPATGTWSGTGPMTTARALSTLTVLPSGQVLVAGGAGLSTAELYDPVSNTFSLTGSMFANRSRHTATLLRDGRVLVVSGATGPGTVPGAELYDPATGTFTSVAPPLVPRYYASATLLPDGRVLLAGGVTGSSDVTTVELYDPAANTWTATGSLTHPRSGHTSTLLPQGKVLVAGGADLSRATAPIAELYDPVTGLWTDTGALATGRDNSTATLLPTGRVLLVGGFAFLGTTVFYSSTELYDPAGERWSPAGNLAQGRSSTSAVLLPTGQVLVAGGTGAGGALNAVERYDRASNTWSPAASLGTARSRPTLSLLPSGQVLAVGGFNGATRLDSAERYDPGSNAWSATGALGTLRGGHTATVLPSGQVLVVGGSDSPSATRYDPATNAWLTRSSPGTARTDHAAVLLGDGRVLVVGGTVGGSAVASAEVYDPATDAWTSVAGLAQARASFTLTLLPSGRVLATGGASSTGEVASAEEYDPTSNTWTATGALATARAFHSASLLASGRVLVVGGQGAGGASLTTAEVYDPATRVWTVVSALAAARARFASVVLPSGEVLVVGGESAGAALASAELYEDTGASPAWRPTVSEPDTLFQACPARVTGTLFRGISSVSGGNYQDSATNFPLVRLQAAEGGRLWSLAGSEMSATGVTVAVPASIPVGTYALSVFANAIPGGRVVQVVANNAPAAADLSASTLFGTPVDITLVGVDLDAGQPLSFLIVTPPAHGTLSGTPPDVTYTPDLGYTGPDSFTYRVRDCGLDSNLATVELNTVDDTPPSITCPGDQVVEATSPAGAEVDYPPATVTPGAHPVSPVTYAPPSGSTLPLGNTTVVATVEDSEGAGDSCTFQVTVRDSVAPTLTCPSDTRVDAEDSGGATVTYVLPEARDSVSGPATVTASPASGSRFPAGTTQVTVTARDSSGNEARCTFGVTVVARTGEGGVKIAGGGCQASGGGASVALVVLTVLGVWARRGRGRRVPALVVLGVLGVVLSRPASAQTGALIPFDAERLRLSPSAVDSLLVDTGRVLPEGRYRLGLLAGYERGILVVENVDGSIRSVLHYRTSAWLMGAWAPVERLELSARLPVIISQGGHGGASLLGSPEPSSFGLGTPEVGARYALLRREDGDAVALALGLDLGLPGGRASAFGRQQDWAGLQFAPRVSLGREVGPLALGASVGARIRATEVEPGRDVGTELEQGLVVATRGEGLRGEVALQVAESLVHPDVAVELLGGVRLPVGAGFEVNALVGHGFTDIPGTPEWRLAAGLAWAPRASSETREEDVCASGRQHTPEQCPENDDDGDSVSNKDDRCPLEAGVRENGGCPDKDSDGDGVVDRLDRCPNEAGRAEDQGCPVVKDSDGDGVPDASDRCPNEAGTAENRGCPVVKDSDGDGVPDASDRCPNEAGTVERQGCPEPVKPAPTGEEQLSLQDQRVIFPVNQADIQGDSARVLDAIAAELKARPGVAVRIEGHTDNTGPETFNRTLSQDRANSVRAYLIQRGVEDSRLEAVGYGPDRPLVSNDTPEGRSQNRRVEFVVMRGGKR